MPKKGTIKKLSRDRDAFWESIHIQDAHRILSPRLFGIWIVMHTLNPRQMGFGVSKLSRTYGLPHAGFMKSIQSLTKAGFISLESARQFDPSTVRLLKRASVCGSSWFVMVPSGKGRLKMTCKEEDEKVDLYGALYRHGHGDAKEQRAYRAKRMREIKKDHNERARISEAKRRVKRRVKAARIKRKFLADMLAARDEETDPQS